MPATVAEHDSVEVAVPFEASETGETLKALHERPVGAVAESAIDPVKFSVLVRVIVELSREPATLVGDVVDMEKSPTCEMKMAE